MNIEHGGDVWREGAPEAYLDFSANLNPDGPPEWVLGAMRRGLERARYYPDVRMRVAAAGLSAHLGLPEACVLPTAGGIEAAALAARPALPDTARHIVAQPTFQEYGRLCGAHANLDRAALAGYEPSAGERLWICNPNNPTGDALTRRELTALLDRAEVAGAQLVVDEAFIEYCPEHSVRDLVAAHPALMVLGSLTKVLAIPGVRLGYLAAHPDALQALRDADDPPAPDGAQPLLPWRLNCLADAVASALPGHAADFEAIRLRNRVRRAAFAEGLSALGFRVYPSQANFLLVDIGRDARPLVERLRSRRILVRLCGGFPGLSHGHIRLCVRTEAENEQLISAIKETSRRIP